MSYRPSDIGIYGLGVMGSALGMNLLGKNFLLSVYNRDERGKNDMLSNFMRITSDINGQVSGFTDLWKFINSIRRPRKIILMIKAGPPIDEVLNQLLGLLEKGDVIIDGGNSHYLDTQKRIDLAASFGIDFIGAGISGGEEGARSGPAIMPGGDHSAYLKVAHILETMAARNEKKEPCCAYIGKGGSGHFVKMVHNGLEYVEMQLLAELYGLLSGQMNNEEIAELFEDWNQGGLGSYLLEITVKILRRKENGVFLLDMILDSAGQKGTGSWSVQELLNLSIPGTMMTSAVFSRYLSAMRRERNAISFDQPVDPSDNALDLDAIKEAYRLAKMINHQQGFKLIQRASETYGWHIDLSGIAEIWSNGCIIKSRMLKEIKKILSQHVDLFDDKELVLSIKKGEPSMVEIISLGLKHRKSLGCFYSAYHYWIDLSSERLPANLIQAQRDFFGAHGYQRIDKPEDENYHSIWS